VEQVLNFEKSIWKQQKKICFPRDKLFSGDGPNYLGWSWRNVLRQSVTAVSSDLQTIIRANAFLWVVTKYHLKKEQLPHCVLSCSTKIAVIHMCFQSQSFLPAREQK
jgi:hypothetical protein